jgi:hypothetical protein
MGRCGGARRWVGGLLAGLLLALLGPTSGAAIPADSAAPSARTAVVAAGEGSLSIRPNPDLLGRLGLRFEGQPEGSDQFRSALHVAEPLLIELADGAPTRVAEGKVAATQLRLRSTTGRRSPALWLVPRGRLDWNLVDAKGGVWFSIEHGMRSPDVARDGLRLVTADLRVGPALAAWRRQPVADLLIANVGLRLPLPSEGLAKDAARAIAKSCAAPNWPGTPGFVTDVSLVDMNRVDVLRCRRLGGGGSCDGPGGDEDEVVYVPSATLRNRLEADAADVPWYTKFSGILAPYGNDQHPYLVWSFYRLDAEGRIEQLARSGLKHAFATANEVCEDATCPFNGNILGRACRDLYNAGSNDASFALSPRSEVIPSTGVWGRCGSVFDDVVNADSSPGCDGVQDYNPPDPYTYRMVLRETTIDPALHPGATFYVDAWYVVRDDVDIFNTMGHRSLQPNYASGAWRVGTLGPFHVGPVIERWLEAAGATEQTSLGEASAIEGRVRVATRVKRLPDGRYRYDYAVMNFDFSRVTTDPGTSEPNLRILSNRGFSAIDVALPDGASVDSSEFRDGDPDAANDWAAAAGVDTWRWTAPPGVTFDWGSLVFLRLVSPNPPGSGEVVLGVADAGSPATLAAAALVPDGSRLFVDGFE